MKYNKYMMTMILSVLMLNLNNIKEFINNELSLEDEFKSDRVLVTLTKEASDKFKKYTKNDFKDIR